MRVTLEFDKNQALHFKAALDNTLRSLAWQESTLKDALENSNVNPKEEKNIQKFLADVSCQRVLIAEVLSSLTEADPEHSIITGVSDTDLKKLKGVR